MKLPVGLQLYSLRDEAAQNLDKTLAKVSEMGYTGIEFAGLYGHEPDEVRELLKKYGLAAVSAHIPLPELLAGISGTVHAYKTIGCPFIAIPWLEEARRPGHELYDDTLDAIRQIGAECKKQGLQLLYHNHDFEFIKTGDEYALDQMYASIPADLLQTELDTCWVRVGGEDPAAYLRKYAGRAPVVHLKDFYMEKPDDGPKYELIGVRPDTAAGARTSFEFRAVGFGLQDMPSILKASQDAHAQWLIVELDRPPAGQSAEEAVRASRDYLTAQGY